MLPTDVLSSELIQGRKKYVLFLKQGEVCAVRSPSIFLQCSDCFLSYHNLAVLGLPIANAVCLMIEEPEAADYKHEVKVCSCASNPQSSNMLKKQ